MKFIQAEKLKDQKWNYLTEKISLQNPLVLVFANRFALEDPEIIADIRKEFPYEHLVFGSTAGEIMGDQVKDYSVAVTAIEFEKSSFIIKRANILQHNQDAQSLGVDLIKTLPSKNLKHVFVVSEGHYGNGSSLIEGIESALPNDVALTGGMCGDGARFEKTLTSYKEDPKEGEVIAIGFYGETLEITFASCGGWLPFGPERIITKSDGNILFEIDGKPALDMYKKYLGDKATDLTQNSLFYPLNVKAEGKKYPVVRTVLKTDDTNHSMILTGDVPEGSKVQLMMASVNGIATGAYEAAQLAMKNRKKSPEVAILVSCIGRKLVMDQRVEEEVDEIIEIIGKEAKITGFYSYGELAPFNGENACELHNQTMTLTLISE